MKYLKNQQHSVCRQSSVLLFLAIAFITILWSGCQSDGTEKIPDVSNINIAVKINRFDQALFAIDTNNIPAGIQRLQAAYPEFMEIYPELIQNQGANNQNLPAIIGGFIKHAQVRKLYDTCQVVYKDMSTIEKEFTSAFKFYKYYFPNKPTPEVTTYISEYGVGAFPYGDHSLAIGLDFFLGEKHLGYQQLELPRYILRGMDKNHLTARALEGYISGLVDEGNPPGKRLIDVMITNGKKLYILDKLMPYTADSIKLAYTQKQVDWCNNNESDLWAYLLSENLLYSVRSDTWAKLVNPSPTGTPKMPADSPGRAGNWLGMQIIRAYMKKYPNTTLEQLIAIKDAQTILDQSKYKPKRK